MTFAIFTHSSTLSDREQEDKDKVGVNTMGICNFACGTQKSEIGLLGYILEIEVIPKCQKCRCMCHEILYVTFLRTSVGSCILMNNVGMM
jgi:hypothetical protein